jgi:recombination protein RecR
VSGRFPEPVARLIEELGKLPGIGPKSAQRLAYHLLGQDPATIRRLADALLAAQSRVVRCHVCQNVADTDPCDICSDTRRDHTLLIVVEDARDVVAIERTGEYRGVYHVLGGTISPMEGIGPEDLHLRELVQRLTQEPVQEVILATDPDVEGDATALYIARLIRREDLKVTRIARGLPVGGDIDYADEVTLVRALEGRQSF